MAHDVSSTRKRWLRKPRYKHDRKKTRGKGIGTGGGNIILKGEEAIGSFILSFKQDEKYMSQVDTRQLFYQFLK